MSFTRLIPARYEGSTARERLAYLERCVANCRKCPRLAETRTHTVFGEGSFEIGGIFIVGEAPGSDEDACGKPFVGRAGQILEKGLDRLCLQRKDVYIANCLKCRPDPPLGRGNRPPTRGEMQDCVPFLLAQIEIVDPFVILALGNSALEALGIDAQISKVRGTVIRSEHQHCAVVPTWHPAYVLRNPNAETYEQFYGDLEMACELLTA